MKKHNFASWQMRDASLEALTTEEKIDRIFLLLNDLQRDRNEYRNAIEEWLGVEYVESIERTIKEHITNTNISKKRFRKKYAE